MIFRPGKAHRNCVYRPSIKSLGPLRIDGLNPIKMGLAISNDGILIKEKHSCVCVFFPYVDISITKK